MSSVAFPGHKQIASITVVFLLLAGCATRAPSPSANSQKDVPKLNVVVDCVDCRVPEEVPKLILDSYTNAAVATGARMAQTKQATLTITAYSVRNLAFLLLAGPLAMAQTDAIQATIAFEGKTSSVEYSSRNPMPFRRIESLANKIGERALDAMK